VRHAGPDDVPLVGEADTLHDAARGLVGGQGEGDELALAERLEADADALVRQLGSEPPAPVLGHQGVADLDLDAAADHHPPQPAAADEGAGLRIARHPVAEAVLLPVRDELREDLGAQLVGARAAERRHHLAITVHATEIGEVAGVDAGEQQARGAQAGEVSGHRPGAAHRADGKRGARFSFSAAMPSCTSASMKLSIS
jgi:hypothetical protein